MSCMQMEEKKAIQQPFHWGIKFPRFIVNEQPLNNILLGSADIIVSQPPLGCGTPALTASFDEWEVNWLVRVRELTVYR